MPSVEQLRYEAFADAVERATALRFPVTLFASGEERLDVWVQNEDGSEIEFRLLEVDLFEHQLVGRDRFGAPIHLPLANVKAVWQRRRLIGRSLSLWFGAVLTSAVAGAVIFAGDRSVRGALGAVFGALLGAIAGLGLLLVFDKWEALYQRFLLYEKAAA